MKVGDLITTYYKGFFRLKKIERRFYTEADLRFTYKDKVLGEEYSPLFHFIQEFDSNGKVKKGKLKACDSQFCQLAWESIEQEIVLSEMKIEALKNMLKNE